ncbi:unnamed protein product, partial [Mesorhabditis belari]|uniref:Uncharacterized protein n=1 Tax=Mesorhabditis belari TaxID=2138241 RepID=A0AAF3EKK1_9BILA
MTQTIWRTNSGVWLKETIYVIGGYARKKPTSTVYSLEVRADLPLKWIQRACLNQRRFSHAACVLHGVIYTAGGLEFVNNGTHQALRHVECYDQLNNQWKTLRQMHSPRSEMAIAAGNGRIYVAGGRNDHGVILSTVEMYHPDNDVWIDVVALPEPRKAASMFFDGRSLLVAGGFTDANMATKKVIRWSPGTFIWHDHSTLNLGRVKMASIIHEEKIYLIGGRISASDVRGTSVVEVFDRKENCWMFDSTLRYPRQGGFLVVIPDSADLILPTLKKPRQNCLQSQKRSHSVNSDESASESDIEHQRANHSSQSSTSETSTE